MSKLTISRLLIVGGALIFIFSLLADVLRIGTYPGINYAQLIGAAVGLVVVVVGFLIGREKTKQ